MANVEEKISMAKLAEQAERYEDMAKYMKEIAEEKTKADGGTLNSEERNLLSVAYKNVVGSKRSAWRIVSSIESKLSGSKEEENNKMKLELATDYKSKIEKELRSVCQEVIVRLSALYFTIAKLPYCSRAY